MNVPARDPETRRAVVLALSIALVACGTGGPNSAATTTPAGSSTAAYTVERLIADTTGDHDGTLCDPPRSYDWGRHGRAHLGAPPSGTTQITFWGVGAWQCDAFVAGTHYQVRDLHGYGLVNGAWSLIGSSVGWWCGTDATTATGYSPCGTTGGDWAMPNANRALHWATVRLDMPAGTQCLVTRYEAKMTGSGSLMSNAGADLISNGTITADAFVGRFVKLTAEWTTISASSCSAQTLRASPPPVR